MPKQSKIQIYMHGSVSDDDQLIDLLARKGPEYKLGMAELWLTSQQQC